MPEHVHLLLKPRSADYDVSRFLTSLKGSVTAKAKAYRNSFPADVSIWDRCLEIRPNGETTFRFWQTGGGYDRNLSSTEQIAEKLEYIHNNPVKRELCTSPTDWLWSSARYYAGSDEYPIAIDPMT